MRLEADFWKSSHVHVAVSPGGEAAAEGLQSFAEDELGARGWCFFQTSGSEGRQKWVALAKDSILASAAAVNAHFSISAKDKWLLALPTWHVGGFGILARSFLSGSPVTRLEGKWDAKSFVMLCQQSGATLASLVPTQVFDIVSAALPCPPSMRMVLVGGGALTQSVFDAARGLGWPLCRTYGMTETASQVASQTPDGQQMEVLPLWNLATEPDGTLIIRGQSLSQGYASQHQTKGWLWEAIAPDAGLRTRDRVVLWTENSRQYLRFVGRAAGIVKILGELVALGPIQDRLDALRLRLGLHAADAAVCDVPDARKEHALILAVSGLSLADAARLLESLNRELPPLHHLSRCHVLPSLPRGDLGKVRLAELRERLAVPQ